MSKTNVLMGNPIKFRDECEQCNHHPVCKFELKILTDTDCPYYEPLEDFLDKVRK